ncbi:hypothetical protein H9Y05_01960 [Crocinitomicaceae bacterium CZZ-1]|uniref:DUF4149 domain-containing protein n=1 Tax=Taishania pollutisoli TaxID=2766479 RepID=A0A8J6TSG1_9FLAO|nr:hypothetical protein [Taishania pollutisoli]MBC9811229.1 hypothetical protein [Taishania pollutisoli]NGF75012.1 hypothetical protein [Fluviicola sp. SGL-29]
MVSGSLIVALLTGIWLGFVGAISFMESWLKFKAPGINRSLGVGIGRLVFKALNRVEWCCFLLITLLFIVNVNLLEQQGMTAMTGLLIVLVVQTFWMLPAMDRRAAMLLNNIPIEPSRYHIGYVLLELLKVGLLVLLFLA